jgi:hypothetical protein
MICLEVDVNGKRVCRAGLAKQGTVSLEASVTRLPPSVPSANRGPHLFLKVGGEVWGQDPDKDKEQVAWALSPLGMGDEVRCRVVEAAAGDEPMRREEPEPEPPEVKLHSLVTMLSFCLDELEKLKMPEATGLARELQPIVKRYRPKDSQRIEPKPEMRRASSTTSSHKAKSRRAK